MKSTSKKEIIYVCLAAMSSIGGLTWIQMAYNDPAAVKAWDWIEWKVILSISAVNVLTQTLIAWKAFLSDPNPKPETHNETTTPNPPAGGAPAPGSQP
jgi:hypothetical protein